MAAIFTPLSSEDGDEEGLGSGAIGESFVLVMAVGDGEGRGDD
jgi:hypothetical protein